MGRKRLGQARDIRGTPAGKFGARLEQLMTASGMTTAEFAAKVGVTEDAVRKYFRGADVPRLDRWPRIAMALGLRSANELLPDLPAE
ncbi:MAG: helix-turn-helix transcriptional regulator [Planctomycetes bacterium]|nr:helix-turn-helix transcriptional regulator [Planctomycetota bacterium]